ncbi:plasmid replication protein RepC [Paracoccus laeviglucosivorans]|uniref:Replication initiation protein RepC n=1 Tax=Paracoccus laeviglucosivorans TaxID=1197861 RepID=A0A521FC25_9RHOB|nr:plasmid replication protein RepC [Paracoccus laeviglucosivorans]SMO93752.1 replication initiation protein RepC [Paracoccus laeviglucosivorans]
MFYQPITSFRRAMDAAPVQRQMSRALPAHAVDKWDALRELAVARTHFGLSDRDLAVLQGLLSFHPGTKLDDPTKLVVFPSNATICERLNGMPCSTMRRHIAKLVETGLIARRDSPNGKRHCRREGQAYGFDLTPLACRFAEITAIANTVRSDQLRIRNLREQLSLMRRDLLSLSQDTETAELIALVTKALRRKLTIAQLEALDAALSQAVENLRIADDTSTADIQNEQHQYSKDKYIPESESGGEKSGGDADLEFAEVIATCDQIQQFASQPVQDWQTLVRAAEEVRPMMGICASAWRAAIDNMGHVVAAVTLAAILQRFSQIRVPGAYLRELAKKAARHEFSVALMIRQTGSQL